MTDIEEAARRSGEPAEPAQWPPTADAQGAVPTPPAIPVPGARPVTGSPRRFGTVGWVIVAATVLLLALCSIVTIFGSRTLRAIGAGAMVGKALVERSRAEYPSGRLLSTSSAVVEGSTTSTAEAHVSMTLEDARHPGFRFLVLYWAPARLATDSVAYSNSDSFFKKGVAPAQPVESFEEMWIANYPDTRVEYVFELGYSTDETRTFECGYTTADAQAQIKTVYFGYTDTADSWNVMSKKEAETANDPDTSWTESEVPTATIVSRYLPDYEIVREFTGPDAAGEVLVRHKKHHGFRLAFEPSTIAENLDFTRDVLGKDDAQSRSFIRWWLDHHPKTVINMVYVSNDMRSPDGYTVDYSTSLKDPDSYEEYRTAEMLYHPETRTWTQEGGEE